MPKEGLSPVGAANALDGEYLRFVTQVMALSLHFSIRKDLILIPDLGARVLERNKFTAGKFVAPHGACFDHKGDFFVSEWVEVGRTTRLRKV